MEGVQYEGNMVVGVWLGVDLALMCIYNFEFQTCPPPPAHQPQVRNMAIEISSYGRKLKIVFILDNGTIYLRTAYEPNDVEIRIYTKYAKILD